MMRNFVGLWSAMALLAISSSASALGGWGGAAIKVAPDETLLARVDVVDVELRKLQVSDSSGQVFVHLIEVEDIRIKAVLGDCRLVNDETLGLIAFAKHDEDSEILRDVRIAWRYSLELKRLVSLDPTTVECINESFGE